MNLSTKMVKLTTASIALIEGIFSVVYLLITHYQIGPAFWSSMVFWLVGFILIIALRIDTPRQRSTFYIADIIYLSLFSTAVAYFLGNPYLFLLLCFLHWMAFIPVTEKTPFVILAAAQIIIIAIGTFALGFAEYFEFLMAVIVIALSCWLAIRYTIIQESQLKITADHRQSYDDMLTLVDEKFSEATNANTAKSTFLATMSHEIRTPINAILGLNTMILRESEDPQIMDYAKDIENSSKSLLSLINDILDFSKIESGKMDLVIAEYDFASMVCDVATMTSVKAQAKDLNLSVNVSEKLPSRLIGDDVRIKQILINILNNAVKYTEKGSVTLTIRGEIVEEGVALYFSVKDTGIGIKPSDMSKLFTKFERIEENRNHYIEGTGLGMSITLQLLEMMDSKLEVQSEYGVGSTFSFTLLQRIADPNPVGSIDEHMKSLDSQTKDYKESFVAPDAHVLVVDDIATNRVVFKNLLKRTQIQIDEADSGYEAINLIKKNHYDIVFLDHMMPGMDGIETLKHIKILKDHPNKDTPIVALTANAVAGAKEMYISEGFTGYLAKPVDPVKLENKVANAIPDWLKKPVPKTESNAKSPGHTEITVSEKLIPIEGITWNYAYLHMPDEETILTVVKSFYQTITSEAEYVQKMYNRIINRPTDEEARDLYRIKVHALKSASALFGAFQLSGMAATLEFASRDGNLSLVRDMTPHFIDLLYSFKEKLALLFEESNEKTPIDSTNASYVAEIISTVMSATEQFDVTTSDKAMADLSEFSLDETWASDLDKLQAFVINFEIDNVNELCKRMISRTKEMS